MGRKMELRKCKKCGIEKELSKEFFPQKIRSYDVYFRPQCIECNKQYYKKYTEENIEELKKYRREYYQENMEEIKQYREKNEQHIKEVQKIYNQVHKEERKAYAEKNKESRKAYRIKYKKENKEKTNEYQKQIRKNNPSLKLREYISNSIYKQLNKNGSSKQGQSINQYLSYTIEQLQNHLESQFSFPKNLTPDGQVWMTLENQGKYELNKWIENDPSTWKWQLDHIKPQSDFKITSMDSQEFRDCWALSNLRPYSARQNSIDGATRIRHKK